MIPNKPGFDELIELNDLRFGCLDLLNDAIKLICDYVLIALWVN